MVNQKKTRGFLLLTLSYRKKNIWRKGINNSKKKNKNRVLNKFFYLHESSPFKCIDVDCTKMLAHILEEYSLWFDMFIFFNYPALDIITTVNL